MEPSVKVIGDDHDAPPTETLDQSWFGKPIRHHVGEFGAIFATICLVVASVKLYRGTGTPVSIATWASIGFAFGLLGYFAPNILHPVWKGWMKFAHLLSIVMTAVLLGLVWCLAFVPISLLLRVIGKKVINMSYRADVSTYWEDRKAGLDDFRRLERQF